jgi:uncharacterized sulfatase
MNAHLEAVPTLPRTLGALGYSSLQTGKWWQGHYRHGGFTHGMTQGQRHGDSGLDIGRQTMQPIYEFIAGARAEKQPFFVWYAPMMPHTPHTPPERLLVRYEKAAPSPHVARYWAMIEWFDETVGALVNHLDEQGLARDTIVVYMADNGWIQDPNSPQYAPKSKQSPYDGGLRTPILVRWPGQIAARQVDTPVISIDIVPTLLSALDQGPTADMQGLNLRDDAAVRGRDAIFGECFTHNAVDLNDPAANLRWRWMVSGDYKVIVPDPRNEPDAKAELYHIVADPREEHDLAAKEVDRVRAMTGRLDAWWRPERQR